LFAGVNPVTVKAATALLEVDPIWVYGPPEVVVEKISYLPALLV
jgi:hypothetical protein